MLKYSVCQGSGDLELFQFRSRRHLLEMMQDPQVQEITTKKRFRHVR